jgi:hypothetical protein
LHGAVKEKKAYLKLALRFVITRGRLRDLVYAAGAAFLCRVMIFFDAIRPSLFKGSILQKQVEGIDTILDKCEAQIKAGSFLILSGNVPPDDVVFAIVLIFDFE